MMSHWIYARNVFFQGRVFVHEKQEADAGSADILRAILARNTKKSRRSLEPSDVAIGTEL